MKMQVDDLEWPSQYPDLNIPEYVWIDLKQAVYAHKPRNLKISKIPLAMLQGLV